MRFFLGFHLDLHRQVGQALQLEPCEDPLHSVAARDAVDKKAGVYEAVNKPSGAQWISGWTGSGCWRTGRTNLLMS
jgi:hypothetical protein